MHRNHRTGLQVLLVVILTGAGISSLPPTTVKASGEPIVPYQLGNWTYVEKPVYPAKINASQIPIGGNWTYVYTLSSSSSYHVYFYGDWIRTLTDYDVYVYDPRGGLEAIHTEAAGLPEHLGTTVDEPFFTPRYSGDYSFLIVNDPRESQGAEAATFMLIEHADCNRWYEHYVQGKVDYLNVYSTTWAYEFSTSSERVEVWIEVPDTLDMYEARLYVMANPSRNMGGVLNDAPLAWELGLYNLTDSTGIYGGYNLEDEGFKHPHATASCEYLGQDMLINYASPFKGDTVLYHLVLIGENGGGVIRFMVKTDFEPPSISIQTHEGRVYSGNQTTISAQVSDSNSGLESVSLNYTSSDWETWTCVRMACSQDQMYVGTIPAQSPGKTIKYKVMSSDLAGNIAEAEGSYVVKESTTIMFSLSRYAIYANEAIVVNGRISHGGVTVALNYMYQEEVVLRSVAADSTGSFSDEYLPQKIGNWTVSVSWQGDEARFEASGGSKSFIVAKIPTTVECTVSMEAIDIGGKITVTGAIQPASENKVIELRFEVPNGSSITKLAYTSAEGTYTLEFTPHLFGQWSVQANLAGDAFHLASSSELKSFVVNNTLMNMISSFVNEYIIYIVAAAGAAGSVAGFLIYWRRRE